MSVPRVRNAPTPLAALEPRLDKGLGHFEDHEDRLMAAALYRMTHDGDDGPSTIEGVEA